MVRLASRSRSDPRWPSRLRGLAVVRGLAFLAALLVAVVAGAQPAEPSSSPEDVEAARALAKEGLAAVKEKRFEAAIEALSRSLELHRAPFTLYTLGLAYKGAGRSAAALESFRQFLKLPSSDAMKSYEAPAEEAVAELEELVGHVVVTLTPDGLEGLVLRIDDKRVPAAALGLPRLIDPGEHVVVADAPGYVRARTTFEVVAKGEARVALELRKDSSAVNDPAPTVVAEESSAPLIAQVTLMGVGTVAVGVGITVGMLGYSQAKDAQYSDDPDAEAARTKSLVGDIVAVSGGVVAGVGLVWLLVDRLGGDDAPDEGPVAVAPYADGDVAGIRLTF